MFGDVLAYFPDYCHNEIQCRNTSSSNTVFIDLPQYSISAALSSQQANAVGLQYLMWGMLNAIKTYSRKSGNAEKVD